MLHILCLVIKWIGILLAVLVALAVSALVLLLFCPVRYRAGIQKTVKEWEAQGRVSWLFGLLRVSVRGGSRGTSVEIRICGLKLSSLKKLFSRKKKKQKSLPAAADRADTAISEMQESVPADAGQAGTESGQAAKEQDGSGTDAPVAEKGQTLGERVGNGADVPLIEKAQAEGEDQTEEPVRQRQNLLKKLWDKIIEKCRGIKRAILRSIAAIRNIQDKVAAWRAFFADAHTKAALGTAWQQILGLLRHAGPQRWDGSVDLGLGDPAATGQVLAVLGATYPIYGGQIQVNPVWDKKVLEGNAHVKGRIYGIKVLCVAGRIYFNRDVKYVIKRFRQNGGKHGTGK